MRRETIRTVTCAVPGSFFTSLPKLKPELMKPLYDRIGMHYRHYRRPDPGIAAAIRREIGDHRRVLNLGAGVGAYESMNHDIVALEPSRVMILQRAENGTPVVQGRAERLPFKDNAFDSVTAILTIHHWADLVKGLKEALRVATKRLILLTWIGFVEHFWLVDYLPQIQQTDERLFPSIEQLEEIIGPVRVITIPIRHDCPDGFLCAYWRRPHAYLDNNVRRAISTFARIADINDGLHRLKEDLESGYWQKQYHLLLDKESMDFGYRLVVSACGP
jgi:SAM-dependent methyltransferase